MASQQAYKPAQALLMGLPQLWVQLVACLHGCTLPLSNTLWALHKRHVIYIQFTGQMCSAFVSACYRHIYSSLTCRQGIQSRNTLCVHPILQKPQKQHHDERKHVCLQHSHVSIQQVPITLALPNHMLYAKPHHRTMWGELRVVAETGTIGCGCSAPSTSPIQYSLILVPRYQSMVLFRPSSQEVRSTQPRVASLSLPM